MPSRTDPVIPLEDLAREYAAIDVPSKIWPGERSWVNRLHPFAEFLARGREVADYFYKVHGRAPLPDDDSIIWQCPELYHLLRRAFPGEE